jgi:hypothetical protein
MLLNLQTACSFPREESSIFLYRHHVFHLNTSARLANFARCLSFSLVPRPLKLGTIILEIRRFSRLDGIDDLQRVVTFQNSGQEQNCEIVERGYSLARPYEEFRDLNAASLYSVMTGREERVTRNWVGKTCGRDWAVAVEVLVKHKVQKLIIRFDLGYFEIWGPRRGLLKALESIGESGMVDKVVVDFRSDDLEPAPKQVRLAVKTLKSRYGWE